jgi:hypothetical protein
MGQSCELPKPAERGKTLRTYRSQPLRLSKGRYQAGLQCHRRLWWASYEPWSPEQSVDAATQALFDQGHRVGRVARDYVPGGVLIDFDWRRRWQGVRQTRHELANGAGVLYEAAFEADDLCVVADILERGDDGWTLIEVKSTTGVREEHIADVALQAYVLRASGLRVRRVEVMHLNRSCRFPDLDDLFRRVDVTEQVEERLPLIERQLAAQRQMLRGSLPVVEPGAHCERPWACPFIDRCCAQQPEHHVRELYCVSSTRVDALVQRGIEIVADVPSEEFEGATRRQIEAVKAGRRIVQPTLHAALDELAAPIAYLDFETMWPALPSFEGCRPYDQVPVQFSVHFEREDDVSHHEWLAEGPGDPRDELAAQLLEATRGAGTVLAWYAPFERQRILELAEALPHRAAELRDLEARTVDLLSIVRDHVYDPGFRGGFGLKRVLPVLVPGLGYDDLVIGSSGAAMWPLDDLIVRGQPGPGEERERARNAWLRYCERDTWALVMIMRRLRTL